MKLSVEGRTVCEYFEGRKQQAYPDPATGGDPWTIGIGHTGPEVRKGLVWMEEQIDAGFARDVAEAEEAVNNATAGSVVRQGQFDGMTLLAFNIGAPAFLGSTLLRLFLASDSQSAADQFPRWDKAGGKSMHGLRRRRAAERALFMGHTAAEAIAIGAATP